MRVAPFETGGACAFDRIMVGPAGTRFAVWQDDQRVPLGFRFFPPTMTVIVGAVSDTGRLAIARLFAYSGDTLFPVRWSRDGGTLYARTRGPPAERIVALDADGGPARTFGPLPEAWRRVDIAAIAHGDLALLTDAAVLARLGRMSGEGLIRGHATLGRDGIALLGTRRSDLELVRVDEASATPIGLNASQVRGLIAIPASRAAADDVHYLGRPGARVTPYLPYQRALVDLRTGQVAGTYGTARLLPAGAEAFAAALAAFNSSPDRESEVILDASRSGDTLAVLLVDVDGDRRIALISPRGVATQALCGRNRFVRPRDRPATRHRLRTFALNADGREENAPGRPVLMLHQQGSAATDAVIYFHGGPGGTMADEFFPANVIGRLIAPNRDIVTVEYSGSQGGGLALTRRLAERGLRAIEEDVEALVRWLDRQHYRRVFVIGTSFGAVPALAGARHGRRFAGIFYIAPLLRLRAPGEWVRSTPIPAMTDTHLAFELAYFGGADGRRRFAADLAALLAAAPLGATDHFYFGDRDRVSRPEDVPAGATASTRILPGTHHMAMLASREMWADILARMR